MVNYLLILYSNFLSKLSRDILVPSLPALAIYFQISQAQAQYAIVINLFGIALARLIWPILSDQFGRKTILIWTHILFIVSTLLCLLSWHGYVFMVGRLLQGFSVGCFPLITRAWVFDQQGEKESVKVFGKLALLIAFSPAIATLLGGALQESAGWQANIGLLLCLAIAGFILSLQLPAQSVNSTQSFGKLLLSTGKLWKNIRFWRYVLPYYLLLSSIFVYFAMAPFILPELYQLSATTLGSLSFCIFSGTFAGSFASGLLISRWSSIAIIKLGLIISCIAGFLLCLIAYLTPPLYLLMFLLALFMVGNGLLNATSKSITMAVAPEIAGSALAIAGFVGGMIAVVIAFITTFLPSTLTALTMLLMLISLLALVLHILLNQWDRHQ